jgi:hypothetical protein
MVPNALRNKDRTITMRVKDVTIISMAGAKDSTVINRKICSVTVGAIDCSLLFSPMEKKGVAMAGSAAQLLLGTTRINQTPNITEKYRRFRRPTVAPADLMFWQYPVRAVQNRPIVFLK